MDKTRIIVVEETSCIANMSATCWHGRATIP